MARADRDMVVGLDVGASGIAVAVYRPWAGAGEELAGVGFSPALGFSRGIITGMDDAVGSVKRAVADAELASGTSISYVYICNDIPGMLVRCGSKKYLINGRQGIRRRDLLEARKELFNETLPAGYSVVLLTDEDYCVDGKPTDDPLGARGRELKVEAVAVVADGSRMEEIHRCFSEAGLKVKQTVPGPLAAAEAVLDVMERELGVVLVDIGTSMTRAAYINHRTIKEMQIFPVGTGHITSDLALVLHTTLEEAERIKTAYGLEPVNDGLTVQPVSGGGAISVPGDLAYRVLRSRVDEVLEFVRDFIHSLKLTATLPGGVVITGGGALLSGLPGLAGEHLSMPVRAGSSRLVPGSVPAHEAYRYTNAVGLALWGTRQSTGYRWVKGRLGGGIVGRIRHWLQ